MADDEAIRVKVVKKLARKKVVGNHKKQVETVKNWFVTDEQGRAEELIREPDAPPRGYGGSRD